MKKIFGLTLAACGMALATQAATAGADVGSWYVAPQVQSNWLDDSRAADDDIGFAFSIGKVASEKWDFELAFGTSEHDTGPTTADLSLDSIMFNAHRVFYRAERVNPYFSLGFGRIEASQSGVGNDSGLAATFGLGLLADLSKSDHGTALQLRGEILGRRSSVGTSGSNATDYIAGLGLQYSWGGSPAAPKVVDSDGDGVPDGMDKCPDTPAGTSVNADGCPLDSDGDGVIDANDKCPGTPAGTKVDANGCELDSDGDGVVDSKDQCPNTPAGAKVNENGCELDSDGDGVVDSQDKCPDTPQGERVDANGCPFKKEIRLEGVFFDTNKADLRPESQATLDYAVRTLKRYPELKIEVAGHTDSRGSDSLNRKLSQSRAESVMQYLSANGVSNTLSAKGYGEAQPIASNTTEEGRQQNRRVTLRILD